MEGISITHLIMFLLAQVVAGAAIYGGIRADLRHMNRRIDAVEDTSGRAHQRIDGLLGMGDTGSHAPVTPVPRRRRAD